MKECITKFARLGFSHFMLYPKCLEDSDDHVRTLEALVERDDIETFDCFIPYGQGRQERLTRAIRQSGKEDIGFFIHQFPYTKLLLSSSNPVEQHQSRLIIKEMITQAVAIGASSLTFASGPPSPANATDAHYAAFADFCRWLCGQLKPHRITALIEPCDTTVHKKFLYGPTQACVKLVESLQPNVNNFGILLDLSHIPLIGETFEQAIKTVAPYLKRVHLGNCVLKDKNHRLYGDRHPPIGFDGGEIDIPELTTILRCLLEAGFISKENRRSMLFEITPWPGRSVEETIADSFGRLNKAWAAV